MIELNLLPDIKLDYIKAQRERRLVTGISVLVSAAALLILVLLLLANGLQTKHLNDLSRDVNSSGRKLRAQSNIDKILTVQNQLQSLTDLHSQKPAASQLFSYLNQLTPAQVSITSFNIDFTQQNMTVTGTADALASVNQYVDTLKFTNYNTGSGSKDAPAFNNVVLSNFSLSTGGSGNGQPANYTIDLAYDKTIFDITQSVTLKVPHLVTTRSDVTQPSDLFQPPPPKTTSTTTQGGQ